MDLPKTIYDAWSALSNDDCAALFGGSLDPAQVLQKLTAGNTGLGYFVIDDIVSAPNTITSATATSISSNNQVTGAIITINDLGGTFINGSDQDRAFTILHELGHLFYDIFDAGGSKILPDGTSTDQSMKNTALVKQKCFGTR